ncbi:PREDICTED: butyrate--CoA ligase AAE11, peroxisomal-like [Populus euphratica]|uniref:Butyrate--CoA ligase AAE11, peroxisomal-like n=1 Tax=Populus euphratica TaxID=75702 RepID=A0AAJ6Y3B3_POPEU|nr:PREDICTED: butyrate--CoA ligase AAE11, peroxisomal-like [Populus euphratica]
MDQLPKCDANYVPLTPINFLKRAAKVYGNRHSVVYEGIHFTWQQTYERCLCLADSLRSFDISKNDVVSVLAPNIPALYEMHFAVPMAGGVVNAINTRLNPNHVATILRHSEAKVFFVDYQFVQLARQALQILMASESISSKLVLPSVVLIDDIESPTGAIFGEWEYEQLVCMGNPGHIPCEVQDEWDPIALNYTSGTTSEPKGVVYSHRGVFLGSLGVIIAWEMASEPVYMWSLPMFHCNGWTFAWGIAARGGTNVCLRNTTAKDMYRNIAQHRVTHMCCAPIVFNILLEAKPEERREITSPVQILVGGAPPPASLLEKMKPLGFYVTHSYGLTEVGPALVCEWQAKWNNLPSQDQSKIMARQGINTAALAHMDVKDLNTMIGVPWDGKTMGEIVLKGSTVMKGYFKDPKATAKAFKNGWFATGDIGVIHPDGYLEIKDRSKDVIISGGENISSVELESVLYSHPRVLEAAVVAMPHPVWGESPCAFLAIKKNSDGKSNDLKEADIIAYCRKKLPRYMVPKKVEFIPELPKTSTGKIQKFQLRDLARNFVVSETFPTKNTAQVNANTEMQGRQALPSRVASSRL